MISPHPVQLLPSLLAADHARLADECAALDARQLPWLHYDAMDGRFVPNINFGPATLHCLSRAVPNFKFDVHLMLSAPHQYIEAYAKAGAHRITIHIEPDYDHAATLLQIKNLGCECGLALNPDTPLSSIEPFLNTVDLILPMTVQPGFGGQSFREDVLEKIATLHQWRQERNLPCRIQVDGGIDTTTGPRCAAAGADTLVAGTAFFKAENRQAFIKAILP